MATIHTDFGKRRNLLAEGSFSWRSVGAYISPVAQAYV
jgi:hypothetical protein